MANAIVGDNVIAVGVEVAAAAHSLTATLYWALVVGVMHVVSCDFYRR